MLLATILIITIMTVISLRFGKGGWQWRGQVVIIIIILLLNYILINI